MHAKQRAICEPCGTGVKSPPDSFAIGMGLSGLGFFVDPGDCRKGLQGVHLEFVIVNLAGFDVVAFQHLQPLEQFNDALNLVAIIPAGYLEPMAAAHI
jgi:hypothetical protein